VRSEFPSNFLQIGLEFDAAASFRFVGKLKPTSIFTVAITDSGGRRLFSCGSGVATTLAELASDAE